MKKINRRTFIKAAAIIGGGIFAGCGVEKNFSQNNLSVKNLRQIISADSSNSRCIMWQSSEQMKNPAVEIKLKNSADVLKFSAVDSTFEDDGEKFFQYTAQIEKLSPNSNYDYRIIDGENFTEFFPLQTSSEKKFKAIIFPDSQSADYDVWGSGV